MSRITDGQARTVVITLVRPPLSLSKRTALASISEGRVILLNDARDPATENLLTDHCEVLLTPGRNIGVAAGRNLLLQTALEMGADVIVSLDDDIHAPLDYARKAAETLRTQQTSDSRAAMTGPIVLSARTWEPKSGESIPRLRSRIRARPDLRARDIDHAGVSRWRDHYLRAHGETAAAARTEILGETLQASEIDGSGKNSLEIQASALSSRPAAVPTDVLAGGTWILDAELIDRVGLLDERLGPFGYEDSEFCIRSRLSGHSHYLMPDLPVLHDMEGRTASRPFAVTLALRNRFRGLLAGADLDPILRQRVIWETLGLGIFEISPRAGSLEEIRSTLESAISAFQDGLQLSGEEDTSVLINDSTELAALRMVTDQHTIRINVEWGSGNLRIEVGKDGIDVETDNERISQLMPMITGSSSSSSSQT